MCASFEEKEKLKEKNKQLINWHLTNLPSFSDHCSYKSKSKYITNIKLNNSGDVIWRFFEWHVAIFIINLNSIFIYNTTFILILLI